MATKPRNKFLVPYARHHPKYDPAVHRRVPNLELFALTDDLLVACAVFLAAEDLARLECTARRFATKAVFAQLQSDFDTSQQQEKWSVAQEAARRRLSTCTAVEQARVPRRGFECWLGRLHELERLSMPPQFDHCNPRLTISSCRTRVTRVSGVEGEEFELFPTLAASNVVMRAGKHYAVFTAVCGNEISFGVVRPGPGSWGTSHDDCCMFHMVDDDTGDPAWKGRAGANVGDRIGMLLDYTAKTMTVYKNGALLGIMHEKLNCIVHSDRVLSGELCWAVRMWSPGDCAQIVGGSLPAPLSADILGADNAWLRARGNDSDGSDYFDDY